MSVEVRPFRSACNLRCVYCYQSTQREKTPKANYSIEAVLSGLDSEIAPFTLFGGEPLLLPLADLERLWSYGFERFGENSIQTNGTLINDDHMGLFRRYRVYVGISIDGPGELNGLRAGRSEEHTAELTRRTMDAIERLCVEWSPPSLIVTLSKVNASAGRLHRLLEWIADMYARGITAIRLHPLELNDDPRTASLVLSHRETWAAFEALHQLHLAGRGPVIDMMSEAQRLIAGKDGAVSCTWLACDPFTTPAVRGVTGDGSESRCGRADKDGRDGLKAESPGYERYIALAQTPRSEGGCQGCRFFLQCKGHCPGTGLDGDWRNRSHDCELLETMFERFEAERLAAGEEPMSRSPRRELIERWVVDGWFEGRNRLVEDAPAELDPSQLRELVPGQFRAPRFLRVAWSSRAARSEWRPRLRRIKSTWPLLIARAVAEGRLPCADIEVAPWMFGAMQRELAGSGRRAWIVDSSEDVVPGTETLLRVFCGSPKQHERTLELVRCGARAELARHLGAPECCAAAAAETPAELPFVAWSSAQANTLLAPLGVRLVPHQPCRHDCAATRSVGRELIELGRRCGWAQELDTLMSVLSWELEWSSLHGIAVVKAPVFELTSRDRYRPVRAEHSHRVRPSRRSLPVLHEAGEGPRAAWPKRPD